MTNVNYYVCLHYSVSRNNVQNSKIDTGRHIITSNKVAINPMKCFVFRLSIYAFYNSHFGKVKPFEAMRS